MIISAVWLGGGGASAVLVAQVALGFGLEGMGFTVEGYRKAANALPAPPAPRRGQQRLSMVMWTMRMILLMTAMMMMRLKKNMLSRRKKESSSSISVLTSL